MGQKQQAGHAVRAVVENMEPRRLMSATLGTVLGDDGAYAYTDSLNVGSNSSAAGGGVVSYVYQVGGGATLAVNRFAVDPASNALTPLDGDANPDNGVAPVFIDLVPALNRPYTKSLYSIDANAAGQSVVAWSELSANGRGVNFYARPISAAGVAGPIVSVAALNGPFATGLSVAIDGDGDYTVAWAQGSSTSRPLDVKLQRVNAAGAKSGKLLAMGQGQSPSIDAAEAGQAVLSWSSPAGGGAGYSGLVFQRFGPTGSKVGSVANVDGASTVGELNAGVDITPDGSHFIVHCDASLPSGSADADFVRVYDAGGSALGSDVPVASRAAAAIDEGGFAVAWTSITPAEGNVTRVNVQKYDFNGVVTSPAAVVLEDTLIEDGSGNAVSGGLFRRQGVISVGNGEYLVNAAYDADSELTGDVRHGLIV